MNTALHALTGLTRDRGVEHFEIDVLPANRAAAALFRSLGFAMRFDSGSLVTDRSQASWLTAWVSPSSILPDGS